jgi:hypothetical protein
MPPALSAAWHEALDRVRRARQRPHHMPGVLLAVLDLLEHQRLALPVVPFLAVEASFAALLDARHLPGRGMAWSPFFNLSGKAGVWDLWLGDRPADFRDLAVGRGRATPRPKSRAGLVRRADRARFHPELVAQLATLQGRAPLRRALESLLRA